MSVDALRRRALGALVAFGVFLAGLLLLPAGTVRFWQAWLYWLVFTVCSTVMSFYFLRHDPALVERRMRAGPLAETVPGEKVIQTLTDSLFVSLPWSGTSVPTGPLISGRRRRGVGVLDSYQARPCRQLVSSRSLSSLAITAARCLRLC